MFDDIELAGQAGDGDEAVQLCTELRPNIILMDLVMPGMSSRRGHAADPSPRATRRWWPHKLTDEDLMGETLRAGAIGYLMEDDLGGPGRRRRGRRTPGAGR